MSEVEYARAADGTYLAFRLLDADAECDAGNDIIMASGGLISMEVFHDDPAFVRSSSWGTLLVRRGGVLSVAVLDDRKAASDHFPWLQPER